MSRYSAAMNFKPILEAAEYWKEVALLGAKGVFTGAPLWTTENIRTIDTAFTRHPDQSNRNFLQKLNDQLTPTSSAVKQLAAEIMWLLLLCPSNVSADKKRENIRLIWDWSGSSLPETSSWLSDKTLAGIGSGGVAFNNYRPKELTFCLNFLLAFRTLDLGQQHQLAHDPQAFANFLQTVPEAQTRQFRHMILFLLFPDNFERIFSAGDRKRIVERFGEMSRAELNTRSALDLDAALREIRAKLEMEYGTKDLDFYEPPLKDRWSWEIETSGDVLKAEHVKQALDEIDKTGIPQQARSSTYDLVADGKRYPPKLVFSLAYKYATGTPLDRRDFQGGEGTEAFQILQRLGFTIVPKNLIPELVDTFLAQANAGVDLRTSSYPSEYRGLQIKVGFGQGTFSRVPWIAFLAPSQRVSQGVYPVLLYYREAKLLILAYGVSETNPPPQLWKNIAQFQTVTQLQKEKYKREPERYGDSYVDTAFQLPDNLDLEKLRARLDHVIDVYLESLGQQPAEITANHVVPAAELTYSIEEAAKDVFLAEDEFRSLLDRLKKKKNIVLQGPPGVGKTFFADRLAMAFIGAQRTKRIGRVQFHASYAYEDFVQGFRPNGQGGFERKDGIFLRFCKEALGDPGNPYVFVIDEINRANLSKVFGELLMLIEHDKRGDKFALDLAYSTESEKRFHVPENVHLIGLMNTADRSLALVDYALRRRFEFFSIHPAFEKPQFAAFLTARGVPTGLIAHITAVLTELNSAIAKDRDLGAGFAVGHSYFCELPPDEEAEEEFNKTIEYEIMPLIREYWYEGRAAEDWRQKLLKM